MPRLLFLIVSLFVSLFMLVGCMVPDGIREHRIFVQEQVLNNPAIQSEYIEQDGFRLHYRTAGTAIKGIAIWVHGTPGSWDDIGRLLADSEFTSDVLLVSLDRPGWGQSQLLEEPGVMPGFDEQSDYIVPLLEKLDQAYPQLSTILVGHSWGGSLVPYLAAEQPELVDGLIILAGGLDPDLVQPRWYNRAAQTWLVDYFLDNRLRAANEEVYALAPELTKMAARWQELKMPVIVVQGEEDELVDPGNADYAEARLDPNNSKVLRLADQGHLLQVERTDLIARCVVAMLEETLADCSE